MRQMMKKDMKGYEATFPEFATQAKLLTKSPTAFKAAIKMAMLNMKMLQGSTTTSGSASSSLFNKLDNSTMNNLINQIKFQDEGDN
mmetsp:Transcript_26623/g.45012  ORF Transcript_26623/g.45012 Transcript_26623/m.45012 type:complete len:86 (+) Transcript_26623:135-392(+)